MDDSSSFPAFQWWTHRWQTHWTQFSNVWHSHLMILFSLSLFRLIEFDVRDAFQFKERLDLSRYKNHSFYHQLYHNCCPCCYATPKIDLPITQLMCAASIVWICVHFNVWLTEMTKRKWTNERHNIDKVVVRSLSNAATYVFNSIVCLIVTNYN